MPNYEYFCPNNQQSVTAHHCSHRQITTWGQLCDLTQTPLGKTKPDATVTITKQTECQCHDGDDHDHDCCHEHDEHQHDHNDCSCHSRPVKLSITELQ